MSTSMQPSVSRRYSALIILGVACIVGYGISKGWFGSGSREVESEGAATNVRRTTEQVDEPPPAAVQDAASKNE